MNNKILILLLFLFLQGCATTRYNNNNTQNNKTNKDDIQIGILNIIKQSGMLPYMVGLNASF